MTKHFVQPAMLLALVFSSMTCHSPTGPSVNDFSISLSDTSCTSAWLNVHLDRSISQRTVEIMRNDSVVTSFAMVQTDTTAADTGLLPNKSYTYIAQLKSGTSVSKPTPTLYIQTLDTTSDNFSWTTYSLGNGGATSSLYDAAIVRENPPLAYAVGEINSDSGFFNVARWDGSDWRLLRIQTYTFCGQPETGTYSMKAVLVLGDTEIYFCDGAQLTSWNGYQQGAIACLPVAVNKMWAANDSTIYTGGNSGQIGLYSNGVWQRLSSGTSLDIQDIYGAWDAGSKQYEILAVASSYPESLDRKIISISGQEATLLSTTPIQWPLSSVWFVPGRHYIAAGSGVYEKHHLSDLQWNNDPLTVTSYDITSVRGNAINDVFAVGAFGEFLHFNGKSWRSFRNETGLENGSYSRVAVKGNLVIAVGLNNNMAVVTVGKR